MRFAAVVLGALLAACGSNRPEIPPELLAGTPTVEGYPAPPYGEEIGDTAESFSFYGWRDPVGESFDVAKLETIRFADFYDPDTTRGIHLLLVNTAAAWCAPCVEEHQDLPVLSDEFAPRGLRILGTLFQDESRQPATIDDLAAWTKTFGTNFAMAIDPEVQMGRYGSPDSPPLNVILDARDMTIIQIFNSNSIGILSAFIDSALAERGSP